MGRKDPAACSGRGCHVATGPVRAEGLTQRGKPPRRVRASGWAATTPLLAGDTAPRARLSHTLTLEHMEQQ